MNIPNEELEMVKMFEAPIQNNLTEELVLNYIPTLPNLLHLNTPKTYALLLDGIEKRIKELIGKNTKFLDEIKSSEVKDDGSVVIVKKVNKKDKKIKFKASNAYELTQKILGLKEGEVGYSSAYALFCNPETYVLGVLALALSEKK